MLLDLEVTVLLTGNNVQHFENLGYFIPRKKEKGRNRFKIPKGSTITVKTQDLQAGSNHNVRCLCDYCLEQGIETEITMKYTDYYDAIHKTGVSKIACKGCRPLKTKECKINRYGTTNLREIADIAGFKIGRKPLDGNFVYNCFIEKELVPQFSPSEYKNAHQKLPFICQSHIEKGVQYTSYDILIFRKYKGCTFCGHEKGTEERRYSYQYVNGKFNEKDYTLISSSYSNADEKLDFVCNKHSELGVQQTTFWSVLTANCSCQKCRFLQTSGENNFNWKGGISSEREKFKITPEYRNWRKAVFQRDDYTCQVCGVRGVGLSAHHILNYSEYPELRTDINNGLTICFEHHDTSSPFSFHSLYSTRNNTPEQLQEYIQRYKSGEFKEIQNKNKQLAI